MPTYNILLVDDDHFILKTISKALKDKRYKVTTADSGEKAIELLNKSTFDLVITDLVMGNIDGFQVLKAGKGLKSEIIVIILTGYSDVTLAIDALRFGADDYLLKPCEPEEMYFRIENCLEKVENKKKIRQAEKELLKAKKLESLGTLAGGIAHDFNNMMTVVLGNISLAKNETKPNSTAFELLTEAEKASLRANDLTARLITFAKGGDPVKKTLHVGRLLKDSVTSSLYEYDINCEFTIPVDIRPAEIDESQMKQVIWNIVTNSVEAMAGQGKIEVYCENTNIGKKDSLTLKHGRYVKISIKDQGPGIPDENISKVFDPYFSTKKMGLRKGIGLGLAVCHSIVEKHDGLIAVESELGVGTTFFIYLPTSEKEVAVPEPATTPESGLPDNGKRKILIMDDEEMVRHVAGLMLSQLGYDAEFTEDGTEAIELYKKAKESGKPFDAVILDLTNQFGMGGKETIEKLFKIDPDVKAIISSGYSNDPIMANFKQYGFTGVLAKPYTRKELSYVLHEVVKRE